MQLAHLPTARTWYHLTPVVACMCQVIINKITRFCKTANHQRYVRLRTATKKTL